MEMLISSLIITLVIHSIGFEKNRMVYLHPMYFVDCHL